MINLVGLNNETFYLDSFNLADFGYLYNVNLQCLYLTENGKLITENAIYPYRKYHLHLRIYGGKGGFGSMLKAIGAQIEKTTNRGACRDLSGRRMRDVEAEKQLKDWVEKKKSEALDNQSKKQEKRDRILNPGKHFLDDEEFVETRATMPDKIEDALQQGFSSSKVLTESNKKIKRRHHDKLDNLDKDLNITISSSSGSSSEGEEESIMPNETNIVTTIICTDQIKQTNVGDKNIDYKILNSNVGSNISDETTQSSKDAQKLLHKEPEAPLNIENNADIIPTKLTQNSTLLINLDEYATIKDLMELGLDALKQDLKNRGMKCGGTLEERAKRLFALKNSKK